MSASNLDRDIVSGTKIGGAPKKLCPPRRLSDTILSGRRAQVLLYGPIGAAEPARESGVKVGRPKKKARQISKSRPKAQPRSKSKASRTHTASRPKRRNVSTVATKQARSSAVSRSRATTPARSTHGGTHAPPTHARPAHARPRPEPVPNPMPTKHVAPPRPVLVTPARSMPPTREQRKPLVTPARGPLAVPDFTEAGGVLTIPSSHRE